MNKELNKIKSELAEEDKYFDLFKLTKGGAIIFKNSLARKAGFNSVFFMQIRDSGEYRGKAFFLDKNYNWELKEDSKGVLILIPTQKNKQFIEE